MPHRPYVTLSDPLFEAAELLRLRRKYRTIGEFIQALIRYDGQTQREHVFTTEWAALSPVERDRLDEQILAQVKKGEGVRGSWLEARLGEVLRYVMTEIASGREPTLRGMMEVFVKEPPKKDA